MNQSESIANLAKALCAVQRDLKPVSKDSRVNAGQMKYTYADFPAVMEGCRDLLTANGIAVMQTFGPAEEKSVTLITCLMHESGEWRDSWLTLPVPQGTAQAFGSAITYARRYGLMAAVGIVTDDDDDGAHASVVPPRQNGYDDRTRDAPNSYDARPSAPNGDVWEGPGQCSRCHAPPGKKHGVPCVARGN